MIILSRRTLRTITATALTPLLLGALSTLPAPRLFAQTPAPSADAETYTFQRTYKAGEVDHYKMVMHNSIAGEQNMEMQFTINYKESVQSIEPDGKVQLSMEFEKFMGNVNGQELPDGMLPMMPKILRTVDKKGQTLTMKLDGGQETMNENIKQMMKSQMDSYTQFLPPHPAKIGDSWNIAIDKDGSKTTGKDTLLGTEIVNGIKTLKLKMIADTKSKATTGPTAGVDIAMHIEGLLNIDPANGMMVRMNFKGNGDSSKTGKIVVKVDMALVNGKDDAVGGDNKTGSTDAGTGKSTNAPASADTKPKTP